MESPNINKDLGDIYTIDVRRQIELYVFQEYLKQDNRLIDLYLPAIIKLIDLNITKFRKLGYWRYDVCVDNEYDEFIVKIFGYDIKVGAFVIWQPYSAHEGMHIGQVTSLGHSDWIKIKTGENKTIERHGYELVLVMQQRMNFENTLEE